MNELFLTRTLKTTQNIYQILSNIEIIPQERFNGESDQTLKIFRISVV
ncbi:hypothetical protein HPHPA16_1167 [Helicobacter pylori Hp A-16]|nr:hypothetical protein HPHPA16_1167 [Helicobacter pylori Hp A-16]